MNRLLLALALMIPFAACGDDAEKSSWQITETCTGADCSTPNPETSPVLHAEFVSGHLGNDDSCRDQGYTPADSGDMNEAMGEPSGAFAEDCAEDGCFTLNCDTAQVTFTITNAGEVAGLGLEVDVLELYDGEGTLVAELPVLGVQDMDDVDADLPMSSVDPNATKLFMMTFRGPAEPYTLLPTDSSRGYGYSGTVVIRFKASNHSDFLLKSPLIYVLDSIAT